MRSQTLMEGRLLWAVLALALALRLGYGLARPPQAEGLADPDGYVSLAASVADSWSYAEDGQPSAHREPAYSIALGLLFKLLDKRYGVLLLFNALLGTAATWLLHRIGMRLFGPTVALAGAALAAVYPPFIFYAAQPMRESLLLAVSALSVWAVLKAHERRSRASAAAAGAAGALAGLSNTTFLPFAGLFAPAGLAWLGWRADGRRSLACVTVYMLVFSALYAVWPLRNYAQFHTLVLGSTAGAGGTFYTYLLVPQALGGTPEQEIILAADPTTVAGGGLGPIEKERYFWRAGLARVRDKPWRYARLVAWRFLVDTWRILPRSRAYAHSYRLLWWTSLLTDGWLIPLGLLGLLRVRGRPPETLWLYLFVFSTALTYSLVLTMQRYRLSLMPWMILFAAAGLARLREKV